MKKSFNPNKAKIHRSYTVVQVAELFNVHVKTVRNWVKEGLPTYADSRPLLILGTDLKLFIQKRRKNSKRQCSLSECYCMRCRTQRKPIIETIHFKHEAGGIGRMFGWCSECHGKINKYVSWRRIEEIWLDLGGKLPIAQKHIVLIEKALLNYPFK